ncbi:hypothetical protein CC2G_011221 [Coprinopsis cinerea AmutBmut pab1-1]|nr:hypothetical protein CC2G_011221 [Coprinopsis cinerea AmutBmut pab1-1]
MSDERLKRIKRGQPRSQLVDQVGGATPPFSAVTIWYWIHVRTSVEITVERESPEFMHELPGCVYIARIGQLGYGMGASEVITVPAALPTPK